MDPGEVALDRLYAGSLKGFVADRKALVAELRAAGDKEGARVVGAAAKPSVPAWVLNQLVRQARADVDVFVAAIDRQRDLQLRALGGELDGNAISAAKADEKDALARLGELAAAILEGDGHDGGKGNVDRVARTLRSAALDPEARPLFLRGRLVRDVAEGGFEAVAAQLDPALLLAALTAREEKPRKPARQVDGFFARNARAGATAETPAPAPAAPTPVVAKAPVAKLHIAKPPVEKAVEKPPVAKPPSIPPPSIIPASVAPSSGAGAGDRAERLTRAKVGVAQAKAELEAQRAAVRQQEERVAELEKALDAATAEARIAKRKLGDLEERLERAEKRVRVLES
jgi:hypothetical protein